MSVGVGVRRTRSVRRRLGARTVVAVRGLRRLRAGGRLRARAAAGVAVAAVRGDRAGAVRDLVRAVAVVLQPRQDEVQIVRGVVVAEDRAVEIGLRRQVPAVPAQVVAGGEGRVVDVVGVRLAVAAAVAARPRPGGRDELHGPDGAVVAAVAVVRAVVGVFDEREAVAVELRAEDGAGRGAVRVDPAAAGLTGLDLADGREELPGQVAAGLGRAQRRLGLLVGVEDGRGYAGLRLTDRDRRAYGRRLRRARTGVRAVQRRKVRVVRRVAGRAAAGRRLGRWLGVTGGLSALVVDRRPGSLGRGQSRDRERGHSGGRRPLTEPPADVRRHTENPSRGRRTALFRLFSFGLGQPYKPAISPDSTPCSRVTPSLRLDVRPCSPAGRPRRPYDNLRCADTRSRPIFTNWPAVNLSRSVDRGGPHAAFHALLPPSLHRPSWPAAVPHTGRR